ncbi:hypothetical protein ACF0H5_000829 [Mactra antiquata]
MSELLLNFIVSVICGSLAMTTATAENSTMDSGSMTTQDSGVTVGQTTQAGMTTHAHGGSTVGSDMTTQGSNGASTLLITLPSMFIALLTVLYHNLQ